MDLAASLLTKGQCDAVSHQQRRVPSFTLHVEFDKSRSSVVYRIAPKYTSLSCHQAPDLEEGIIDADDAQTDTLEAPSKKVVKKKRVKKADLEVGTDVVTDTPTTWICSSCGRAMADTVQDTKDVKEKKVTFKNEEGKPVEEKVSSLKHGKFLTDGRIQEFVYIPTAEFSDIAAKSSDLFDTILRHWNLPRPQLLIKFQSGFAHPKHLLSLEEIKKFEKLEGSIPKEQEPEIYKYYKYFKDSLIAEKPGETIPDDKLTKGALKLLNDFLFKSVNNLIDVIVRAAVRNRCWILVEGGPNGGLLLLKLAAERCKERPVILVINALKGKRFPYPKVDKKVKHYVGEKHHLKNLADLVELEALNTPASNNKVKEAVKDMVDAMHKEAWSVFQENQGQCPTQSQQSKQTLSSEQEERSKWSEKDQREVEETKVQSALLTARILRHAKPIEKADMNPLKLGVSFWDSSLEKNGWECQTSTRLESHKIRWNHWHFRGGTHYIFTDDDTSELLTDCLAPSGCIFLGGGGGSKKELMKMLTNGEPVVCLDNTGRLTQDFVRCHNFLCTTLFREADETDNSKKEAEMKKRFQSKRSGQMSFETMHQQLKGKETTDFLKGDIARRTVFRTLTFNGEQGVRTREDIVKTFSQSLTQVNSFSQPELCELFITYLRRGVVMDPLNPRECSGGHTEDKLSMCLSNFLILASNDTSDFADVEAVKAASRLEDQLMGAAKVERWWALFMTYMLLGLNFFSLLLALARNSTAPAFLTWMPAGLLRWGLPGVSAASTFISGLIGRFRFMLRWSKARSAAAQLEAEIWKFRTRVSDYVVVGSREDEEGTNRSSELGQAFTRERKQDVTRNLFRSNVTNIFNSAMEEMGTSSLHGHGFDKLPSSRKRHNFSLETQATNKEKLRFLEKKLPRLVCWCFGRAKEEVQEKDTTSDGALNQSDLSKFGHIGVDDYYHQRTLEVLWRMKHQAFWLTFMQGGLESCVLLLGSFGVLLSTLEQTEMAMICLSLAASLQALERFHALSNRLDAANSGERDMICAWQEWSSVEPMQRRFQLVLTTEGVNVALTSAATAGVRQSLSTTKPN
eukprot:symbB.v1.2.026178.t1/scaffold2592.1/size78170/3